METHIPSADPSVFLHGTDRHKLARRVISYIRDGLAAGEAVVVFASSANAGLFYSAVDAVRVEIDAATRENRYLEFDAEQVRRRFVQDGRLDSVAFIAFMRPLLQSLAEKQPVRVYCEVVSLLWSTGECELATEFERAWNALRALVPFTLLFLKKAEVPVEWGTIPKSETPPGVKENRLSESEGSENRDQKRLELLVRAGEMFHQSLDVTATLNNVARLAVESFAEICLFDLIDERAERLFVTASAHRDRSMEEALAGIGNVLYVEEFGVHPVVRVTQTGEPFFLPHIDDEVILAHAASRLHEQYMRRFGYRSKIVVPVIAQSHIFGALTFVRTHDAKEFDQADLQFAIELGRRAGLAVANAKQFHREQYVAETLQRAFLPRRFPTGKGLEVSAHYRPGSTEADIGGDWYDAFENEHGEVVVTIGDVTGKGIEAARLMVLMRQAIRVAALTVHEPRDIASIVNKLLMTEGDRLASAFIGVIDPKTRVMRYASAGHAPPMLREPDGTLMHLESPSAPLGAFGNTTFEQYEVTCPSDSMLVLYTDGVIEISRDPLAGEAMLERVLSTQAVLHASNPAEFIERAIANQAPRDDIAILAVNFSLQLLRWQVGADDARSAYTLRHEYLHTVARLCDVSEEDLATCGLIFAELIGNVVRHAPGSLSISLQSRGEELVLHLIDKGPGFDYEPALPANVWAESGRGLYLISMLARNVRVERLPGMGSHIAVTLPVTCAEKKNTEVA